MLSKIWCARNRLIFNGFHPNVDLLLARILPRQTIASSPPIRDCIGVPPCPTGSVMYPIGFFDEAAQQGIYGAGMIIKLSSTHTFHLCMGVGQGSNTRSELLALWGLLRFAELWNFAFSHIFGDSLCVINWVIVRAALRPLSLHHWLEKVRKLIHKAGQVVITHIRRGFNMEADGLSKQALGPFDGRIHYKEFREGILVTDSFVSTC